MPEPSQTALDGADPIITRIVRMKLRASLRPDDYREHNLDALDLLGDIRLKLIRKLGEPGESVESFSSYAATVAYNTCSDYVRAKYPERARLRNAIRRLFEKSQQHALWQDSSGDLLCGFAGWRQLPPANGTQLAQARQEGQFDTSGSESLHTLLRLADQILDSLGAPLMLDELVSLVSHHSGLQEPSLTSIEPESEDAQGVLSTTPSVQPAADSVWLATERLRLLWAAIQQLLPWHRAAYLLNLRDGELDALPYYGVATVEQIGEALALTPEQYAALSDALSLDEEARSQVSILSGSGQKFTAYWKYLPLEDNLIAGVLNATRPQVIAYRNKAIERLRRQLRSVL